MSTLRKLAVIACLSAASAAGGCAVADTGSFVRLQEEVEALKQEVSAARRAAPAASLQPTSPGAAQDAPPLKANPEEILALRQEFADISNTLDGVKTEVRAAGTRIDENKVEARKEISRLNGKTDEAALAIQELKSRQAKLDDVDRRLASIEERLEKAFPASRGGGGRASQAAPQDWKSAEDMYDYALGTLKGGETAKARSVFESFSSKYPGHKLSPNVLYWRGESFYMDKDHENAIIAFQDVIDKFPSSDKAPDAMFKQGLSFLALNDHKNAKTLLELLLSKFPKAPAAEKARQKLSEIK
jgi:tol-pal system protein YbgF